MTSRDRTGGDRQAGQVVNSTDRSGDDWADMSDGDK